MSIIACLSAVRSTSCLRGRGGICGAMAKLLRPLWRYADFQGRSDRSEFWLFFSLSALVFVLTVFGSLFDAQIGNAVDPAADAPRAVLAYLLWWLATAVPWFALQVRRFRDIGLTGWLALINGVAYLALLIAPPIGLALFCSVPAADGAPEQACRPTQRYGQRGLARSRTPSAAIPSKKRPRRVHRTRRAPRHRSQAPRSRRAATAGSWQADSAL